MHSIVSLGEIRGISVKCEDVNIQTLLYFTTIIDIE